MRCPLVATLLAVAASAAIALAMLLTLPAADLTLAHDPELVLLSPRWLALIAIAPLLALGMRRSLADLPTPQRALGLLVRTLLLATLAIALARPARTEDATRVATVILVDVSDSVSDADLERARARVAAMIAARGEGEARLVTFAREARVIEVAEDAPVALERHGELGTAPGELDLAHAVEAVEGLALVEAHPRRGGLAREDARAHGERLTDREPIRERERGDRDLAGRALGEGDVVHADAERGGALGLGERVAGGLGAVGEEDDAAQVAGGEQAVGELHRRREIGRGAGRGAELAVALQRDRSGVVLGELDHPGLAGEGDQAGIALAALARADRDLSLIHI